MNEKRYGDIQEYYEEKLHLMGIPIGDQRDFGLIDDGNEGSNLYDYLSKYGAACEKLKNYEEALWACCKFMELPRVYNTLGILYLV